MIAIAHMLARLACCWQERGAIKALQHGGLQISAAEDLTVRMWQGRHLLGVLREWRGTCGHFRLQEMLPLGCKAAINVKVAAI